MSSAKKIEVNSSSLVGLKAELFRKQEELRKERFQQNSSTVKAKPLPKKLGIWSKKNAGVQSRAEKDKSLTVEEENQLDKSRSVLEAKSKLYEQMSKRALLSAEDEGAEHFLVDFEQKAIDDLEKQTPEGKEREDKEEEYELGATDVPGPVHPDEEWVDYVDTLGRSRRCMKKDLPELIQMDKRLNPQAFQEKEPKDSSEPLPDLLSSDMYREMMRKKWEREEEELRQRGPGPVHYQNVRFDEVRELGVGYFGFSKDEGERQEQMEMLQHLRDQTVDQRTKSQQLKAKRKAALQARLDKVKQRKRLKGELVEDEEDKEEEEEETKEEEERQEVVDVKKLAETINRKAPVRPWDVGKDESRWERVKKQVREERPQEFAPCYGAVTAPSRNEFAPPRSYSTPSQTLRASHEHVTPKDSGSTHATRLLTNQGLTWMGQTHPREQGKGAEVTAGQTTTAKDGNSQKGQNISTKDSIAHALSFFRHNAQK